jgi:ferritin
VIDEEFRGLDYKDLLRQTRYFLRNATQQHLTHGEMSTEYFTRTDIAIEAGGICQHHINLCFSTTLNFLMFLEHEVSLTV